MVEINEKGHVSVIIGSLEKTTRKARLTGKLNSNDPYILEAIYKLLGACYTTLSQPNRRTLTTLYNRILTTSKNTCMPMVLPQDKKSPKSVFIQAEFLDCNTYPVNEKIFYWQEDSYYTTNADVVLKVDDTGFLKSKSSDTFTNFDAGKTIPYTSIGRICFAITDTKTTSTFKILNSLGIDVTSGFTKTFINSINTTLYVSTNIYSHGDILFKINKLT
jgi:hypothetical protein